MIGAGEILVAGGIGFLFCKRCYRYRYELARQSGYYSYLYCIAYGVPFLLFGAFFNDGTVQWQLDAYGSFAADCFFGLLVAVLTAWLINTFVYDKSAALQAAWKDDLSRLLSDVISAFAPLQVTLVNRKVYVGMIVASVEPDQDSAFLSIVPTHSGYRDRKTLELRLTHKYDEIFEALQSEDADMSRYNLVIPKSEIASISRFDITIYEKARRAIEAEEHTTQA